MKNINVTTFLIVSIILVQKVQSTQRLQSKRKKYYVINKKIWGKMWANKNPDIDVNALHSSSVNYLRDSDQISSSKERTIGTIG